MDLNFDFKKDPFENFSELFLLAQKEIPKDPNAMSLATSDMNGNPSVRTVLFKGIVRQGFSFYTNYQSQKSQELLQTGKASLLFYWPPLDIQIRITGDVEKLTRAESEKYFSSRPRLSQLGAWASHQSHEISSSAELQAKVDEFDRKFQAQEIPCPEHWGGFHVLPLEIEFWFGKQGRLHERYVYQRADQKQAWKRLQKSP